MSTLTVQKRLVLYAVGGQPKLTSKEESGNLFHLMKQEESLKRLMKMIPEKFTWFMRMGKHWFLIRALIEQEYIVMVHSKSSVSRLVRQK